MLKERETLAKWLRPEDLALHHVANSNIIQFLESSGVNLDPFYKLLWRHVLCVELLKLALNATQSQSADGFLERVIGLFRDNRQTGAQKKAAEYLRKWGDSFWETTEFRVKEITNNLEAAIASEVGVNAGSIGASSSAEARMSRAERAEIVHRAQRVVNSVQAEELNGIIELTDRVLDNKQRRYYLLVDRLDEDWVDDALRHKLIMGLLQATRDFRDVRHAKLVVALRRDLLERVFRVARNSGFQKEKYESRLVVLNWTRTDLKRIADRRVHELVKSRYHSRKAALSDLLPEAVGKTPVEDALFALVRTPRDVIRLLNACISHATGRPQVSVTALKKAIGEYSRSRFDALCDEWSADYPNLAETAAILRRRPDSFKIGAVESQEVAEYCLDLVVRVPETADPAVGLAREVVEGDVSAESFLFDLMLRYYRIGLIGLKLETYETPTWVDVDGRVVSTAEVTSETSVLVHPAYHRALGIKA